MARTLETEWNAKLGELETVKQEYRQRRGRAELASTLAEMREVIANLGRYWHGGEVDVQEKKELLRCVIEGVFLRREKKVIRAEVVWYGGACSELEVPKYLFTAPRIYYRVLELARSHTDAEIAAALNAEGSQTVKGRPWTSRRVMDFRLSNGIPSGLTASPRMRLSTSGYVTSAEVAEMLGVNQSAVQRWFQWGVLDGKQDKAQGQLWIHWTDEVSGRMEGTAAAELRMVSIRRLCAVQGKRPWEVLTWARSQGHQIFRLRRGSTFRFYILPRCP